MTNLNHMLETKFWLLPLTGKSERRDDESCAFMITVLYFRMQKV